MRDVTPKSRSGHLNREKGEAQRAKGDEDGTEAEDRESPLRRGANKKEVKQPQFHLPGWVGCCMSKHSGGSAGLPCQAGLRPHSRVAFWQFDRRLTTKELLLQRFVAPQMAGVNVKNRVILNWVPDSSRPCDEHGSRDRLEFLNDGRSRTKMQMIMDVKLAETNSFCGLAALHLIQDLPHQTTQRHGTVWLLKITGFAAAAPAFSESCDYPLVKMTGSPRKFVASFCAVATPPSFGMITSRMAIASMGAGAGSLSKRSRLRPASPIRAIKSVRRKLRVNHVATCNSPLATLHRRPTLVARPERAVL
jgi:hypothetical protein